MKILFKILFIFFVVFDVSIFCYAQTPKKTGLKGKINHEITTQFHLGVDSNSKVSTYSTNYIIQNISIESTAKYSLKSETKFAATYIDSENKKFEKYSTEVKQLYGSYFDEIIKLKVGMQQTAWSDAFVFPILNLVNPHDLSQPFYIDSNKRKLAVPLINLGLGNDFFEAEWLIVPLPRNDILPITVSNPSNSNTKFIDHNYIWFKDAEFGFKFSSIFNSFFADIFVFNHWNRNSVIVSEKVTPTDVEFRPHKNRVLSLGSNLYLELNDLILRSEVVFHKDFPEFYPFMFTKPQLLNFTQAVLGMDYYNSSNEYDLGIELHTDYWEKLPTAFPAKNLAWLAFKAQSNLMQKKYNISLMLYRGINTNDLWVNPKLTFNIKSSLRASLEWNIFDGIVEKTTNPELFKAQKYLVGNLSYLF